MVVDTIIKFDKLLIVVIQIFIVGSPSQLPLVKPTLLNVLVNTVFKVVLKCSLPLVDLESWDQVFLNVVNDLFPGQLSQDEVVDIHELEQV